VEIYGVDAWQPDGGPPTTVWTCANSLLSCATHTSATQNYARFVTGDPQTAVRRLFAATAAPETVDLAYVRTNPAFGDAVQNALQIADPLAPGGLIVFHDARPSQIEAATRAISGRYPGYCCFVSNFGMTGIVLAATFK
jgi:hypothetical protein